MTSITKQRVKLNIKVLGVNLGADQGQAAKPVSGAGGPATSASGGQTGEKQQVREQFKAPDMSIVSKLMSKVRFFCLFHNSQYSKRLKDIIICKMFKEDSFGSKGRKYCMAMFGSLVFMAGSRSN